MRRYLSAFVMAVGGLLFFLLPFWAVAEGMRGVYWPSGVFLIQIIGILTWAILQTMPKREDKKVPQEAYDYRHLTQVAQGMGFDDIAGALTELVRLRGADGEGI